MHNIKLVKDSPAFYTCYLRLNFGKMMNTERCSIIESFCAPGVVTETSAFRKKIFWEFCNRLTDFEMISFREEGNTGLVYLRTFSGTLKLLILFLTIVPTGRSSFVIMIFTNEQKISPFSCQNVIFNQS